MIQIKKKCLLIDSHALIHRAYHAYPANLITKAGIQVNAVYGFSSILLNLLVKFNPDYIICIFDGKGKTFRHNLYPKYKAQRPKMDQELIDQIAIIKEIVSAFNIPILQQEGFEADDVIGSLAKSKLLFDLEKIIVTGDKDLLQLLDANTLVYLSGSSISNSQLLNTQLAEKKLGFSTDYLVDYKALRGDPSDNIPGVNGIGDKTATDLVKNFQTLENVYKNINEIKGAVNKKLLLDKDQAFLSKNLATIICDLKVDFDLSDALVGNYDLSKAKKIFNELEFYSLLNKFPQNSTVNSLQEDFIQDLSSSENLKLVKVTKSNFKQFESDFTKSKTIAILLDQKLDTLEPVNEILISFDEKQYVFESNFDLLSLINWKNKLLITFDAKLLVKVFNKLKITLEHKVEIFDIKIIYHLLSGGKSKPLDYIINEAFPLDNSKGLKNELLLEKLIPLYKILDKKFKDTPQNNDWSLSKILHDIENPLIFVLAQMEEKGIKLDTKYLEAFANKLDKKISSISFKIYKEAGLEFNISSPKQLGDILFNKLSILGGKKGKSGSFKTSEKVLKNYRKDYPIIDQILEYRELTKLKSTYTSSLINQVNNNTGRIHSYFDQTGTVTGRLSSKNPNLQNIPTSTDLGKSIKKAFVAEENTMFVALDYSQQELRILAHLSDDKALKEAFNKGVDIHNLTASRLFAKDINSITASERRKGKTVNFGIVYGMSSFGFADRLKTDTQTAQNFIDTFFNSYPAVKEYFDQLKRTASLDGYISSLFGRIKNTQEINSSNWRIKSALERELINFPLQSSAADMMKLAMVEVNKIIQKKYADFADLILQIHDEIIFEVKQTDLNNPLLLSFVSEVKDIMTNIIKLSVEMKVDVKTGQNLGELKEFD